MDFLAFLEFIFPPNAAATCAASSSLAAAACATAANSAAVSAVPYTFASLNVAAAAVSKPPTDLVSPALYASIAVSPLTHVSVPETMEVMPETMASALPHVSPVAISNLFLEAYTKYPAIIDDANELNNPINSTDMCWPATWSPEGTLHSDLTISLNSSLLTIVSNSPLLKYASHPSLSTVEQVAIVVYNKNTFYNFVNDK